MFLANKYTKFYFDLCTSRSIKTTESRYHERHHIIPKSMGGSNDSSNLVKFTAKEHYIAHRLLVKMLIPNTIEYFQMVKALAMMNCSSTGMLRYSNATTYDIARRMYRKNFTINHPTRGQKRIKFYNEVSDKLTNCNVNDLDRICFLIENGFKPNTSRLRSEESKSKLRKPRGPCSAERRENIRLSRLGKPHPINSDHKKTLESRKLFSEWSRTFKRENSNHNLILYNTSTRSIISFKVFPDLAKHLKVSPGAIRQKIFRRTGKMVPEFPCSVRLTDSDWVSIETIIKG